MKQKKLVYFFGNEKIYNNLDRQCQSLFTAQAFNSV